MHNNTSKKILQDLKKNGKPRPWREKKVKSLSVSGSFARVENISRAERIFNCGSHLQFAACVNDDYKKLVDANFCRDRMCPMCNWRRSLMLQNQILKILHIASEREKMRFLFVTLTMRNMPSDELSDAVSRLLKSFNLFIKYKAIDSVVIGYVRNLEVTYNQQTGEYHPHIHVLMAVKPSYFKSRDYIPKMTWVELWQKALDAEYAPSVHVKDVKTGKDTPLWKAAAEMGKYSVKDGDYVFKNNLNLQDSVVSSLASALHGRRLISFGKLFRDIKKELKLGDVEGEAADLVGADERECRCPICLSELIEILYTWNYGFKAYMSDE